VDQKHLTMEADKTLACYQNIEQKNWAAPNRTRVGPKHILKEPEHLIIEIACPPCLQNQRWVAVETPIAVSIVGFGHKEQHSLIISIAH